MVRKEIIERRNSKRYKAIEGTYAAISPYSNKLGPISNISSGGLCFTYIDTSNWHQESRARQDESIFLSSIDYYVGDLPFRIISDCEVTNIPTFSSMKIRKNHIQFEDLNLRQWFDLDIYLRKNVSGQVEEFFKQVRRTKNSMI